MIDQQTVEKLKSMRLHAMADFVQALLLKATAGDLSVGEQIGMMVDHEWLARENRRLGLLLKNAKIPANACVEDIWCEPARGLDKSFIRSLATCQWVRAKHRHSGLRARVSPLPQRAASHPGRAQPTDDPDPVHGDRASYLPRPNPSARISLATPISRRARSVSPESSACSAALSTAPNASASARSFTEPELACNELRPDERAMFLPLSRPSGEPHRLSA